MTALHVDLNKHTEDPAHIYLASAEARSGAPARRGSRGGGGAPPRPNAPIAAAAAEAAEREAADDDEAEASVTHSEW